MKRHLVMACPILWILGTFLPVTCFAEESKPTDPAKTSTEWRNDVANLEITKKFNQAYARLPFSVEYEGVLDTRPFSIDWTVGPNLPVAWKGGVAGMIGDEIILTGGLWMPERLNVTYAYNTKTHTYRELPAPPVRPAYTQGACDGRTLFVVGGRSAGRHVFKLAKDEQGDWKWSELARLPESDEAGRWLAAVGMVPGKWLFVVGGHMTGTPSETEGTPRMPDFRLRLDKADAVWEPMSPYPAGDRDLIIPAVARGKLYVFGGSNCDRVMREIFKDIYDKYGVNAPYNGVPNYRDAFCYDPDKNQWKRIRNLPMPMVAGGTVVLDDRYVLLLGSADVRSYRVGKTTGRKDPYYLGYGDLVLCYDVQADNYCRVGVMPYGVATTPWVTDGHHVYGFGGEPSHGYIMNTENVVQIGTLRRAD
ncbi:MAG: hypothetical protein JXM70_27325 [Pirellulales bacterium]|nr:hypothetical protein [Pirellulales bacterium]